MQVLISGKKNSFDPLKAKELASDIGVVYSEDRFYTLINDYADKGLRKNSLLLYVIVTFLFRSSNYKHATTIVNGKPIWIWFVDIFCWLCLIAFVVCLVSGIAQPIVAAISGFIGKGDVTSLSQEFAKTFGDPVAIVLLVVSFLCFIIAMFYIYLIKKVVAVNKKLALKDFVIQKVSFMAHFDGLLKVSDSVSQKTQEKIKFSKRKPIKFNLIHNMEIFTVDNRWLMLQITNLMNRLFPNYSLLLLFNNLAVADIEKMKKVCDSDFHYLVVSEFTDSSN